MKDIKKLLAYYDFLLKVPHVRVEDLQDGDRVCFICREAYDAHILKWTADTTIHYPVILPCGRHHVGIQCLIRWMLSPDFDNHCSLDRTEIVPGAPEAGPDSIDRTLVEMVLRSNGGVIKSRKDQFLKMMEWIKRTIHSTAAVEGGKHRVMILLEEFHDRFAIDDKLAGGDMRQMLQAGEEPVHIVWRNGIPNAQDLRHLMPLFDPAIRMAREMGQNQAFGGDPVVQLQVFANRQPPNPLPQRNPHTRSRWPPHWLPHSLRRWLKLPNVRKSLRACVVGFFTSACTVLSVNLVGNDLDKRLEVFEQLPKLAVGLYGISLLLLVFSGPVRWPCAGLVLNFLWMASYAYGAPVMVLQYLGIVALSSSVSIVIAWRRLNQTSGTRLTLLAFTLLVSVTSFFGLWYSGTCGMVWRNSRVLFKISRRGERL